MAVLVAQEAWGSKHGECGEGILRQVVVERWERAIHPTFGQDVARVSGAADACVNWDLNAVGDFEARCGADGFGPSPETKAGEKDGPGGEDGGLRRISRGQDDVGKDWPDSMPDAA